MWQFTTGKNQVFVKKGDQSSDNSLTLELFSVASSNDAEELTGPRVEAHFGLRWWPKNTNKQKAAFDITSDNVKFECPLPVNETETNSTSEETHAVSIFTSAVSMLVCLAVIAF
jgi:hypothetical protein